MKEERLCSFVDGERAAPLALRAFALPPTTHLTRGIGAWCCLMGLESIAEGLGLNPESGNRRHHKQFCTKVWDEGEAFSKGRIT